MICINRTKLYHVFSLCYLTEITFQTYQYTLRKDVSFMSLCASPQQEVKYMNDTHTKQTNIHTVRVRDEFLVHSYMFI
jgi:hypothetical protein